MNDYNCCECYLENELKKWAVNDYYTPNIKAEVILDMLLTPYITEIVQDQCKKEIANTDKLYFVTKEMSIMEFQEEQESINGNRGTKIDYILANEDKKRVYLVELKTAHGNINKKQVDRYIKNCNRGKKNFGTVFGNKLLQIMKLNDSAIYVPEKMNGINGGGEKALLDLFNEWVKRYSKSNCPIIIDNELGYYTSQARGLLKGKRWESTKKYLYTMGQILDYLYKKGERVHDIWDWELRLIYITPDGRNVLPKNSEWEKDFYIKADNSESVSLKESLKTLKNQKNEKSIYAKFLSSIIEELYT